jgi:cob(I)alamin adenosyltransferase
MDEFYTRIGDDGYTGLLGEGRVPKHSTRIEAIGAIDEAVAAFGVVRVIAKAPQTDPLVLEIQRDLYHLMTEVASTKDLASQFSSINSERIEWLETQISMISQKVEIPKEFIVPGDSYSGAVMALARTVVRRAERRVERLFSDDVLANSEILRYLNRLSSLCFVLELLENTESGKSNPTLAKEP